MTYRYILDNPYIVGVPIQREKMFFGREEDFRWIRERVERETKGLIITLVGEQRSGKTSILYQIINGRLGDGFLPFFIDMQTMVDVTCNRDFLHKIYDIIKITLSLPPRDQDFSGEGFGDFEQAVRNIQMLNPWKKIILMFDEYELLENKFDRGQVNQEIVVFFASLMENFNVIFLFTGSYKLRDRNPKYWKSLLSKSSYRNISFLNKTDCINLITKPLEGYVLYTESQSNYIYRLTAGQPLYTQVFCHHIVTRLKKERRNEVKPEDIGEVIDILVNEEQMPQMIYFWSDLTRNQKIILSILAHKLEMSSQTASPEDVREYLLKNKLQYLVKLLEINPTLESLVGNSILARKGTHYLFIVDLFRFWIKQDQNIWRVLHEYKLDHNPDPIRWDKIFRITGSLVLVAAIVVIAYITFSHLIWDSNGRISHPDPDKTGVATLTHLKKNSTALQTSSNITGNDSDTIGTIASVVPPSTTLVPLPSFGTIAQEYCRGNPSADRPGAVCNILTNIRQFLIGNVRQNSGSSYSSAGFILKVLSDSYQLKVPDSLLRNQSWAGLYDWMEKNGFQPKDANRSELQTGDLVNYRSENVTSVLVYLKYRNQSYVIGVQSSGIKLSRFNDSNFESGLNYFRPSFQ